MASFSKELKDNLVFLSDPKLNLRSEASWVESLLVDGNEKTRLGADFLVPKVQEGILDKPVGWDRILAEDDGVMEGVGGSERTPEVAETGKVKPGPLSEETACKSGFLIEIDGNEGLIP